MGSRFCNLGSEEFLSPLRSLRSLAGSSRKDKYASARSLCATIETVLLNYCATSPVGAGRVPLKKVIWYSCLATCCCCWLLAPLLAFHIVNMMQPFS